MPTFAAAIVPRFVREQRSSAVPSVVEAGVIAILKHFEKLYTHMPLFTPYFSLDSSAYRVGNGGRLRCHMGAAGIGIYVMLLSHLRDCRDYRAPLDYDLLAFDLHEDADAVRRVVEEFDLFDIDRASGTFTSSALNAVRALGTSDSPSSGRASTRTGRVRRVRTAAQAYRRSVRRLAADNALPPEADDQAGEEGDDFPAENDFPPAEEEEKTNPADALPAENEATATEQKEETPPVDALPAENEATATSENARSPRTEEKRGEQKKIPHTPIVPFPPSGKGTRASHSSAPVVEEEEGASEAEVEDAIPAVADTPFTPAEEEPKTPPADSPTAEIESAPADTRTPHGETNTTQTTTSADAPDNETTHGETDTTQATTSDAHPDTRTPHGEGDTTQAKTAAAHPDTRTPHGEGDTTQATISADAPDTEAPAASTAADARGADDEDGGAFVPPTANEVRRFAQALHHPEFDAEWFVHYYTARHWQRHNGHPVRSWQTTVRYWLTHPLEVAQHLLRHRPDPGAAPAGTGAPLGGISPSSAGTSPSPAGVVATAGSANPSSPGIGAAPAGTRTSSPASGVPLGGSLSLPAPTPLQQSRLCDLRHMVLQLFADTPAAAPAAASTVPDAPTAASTPASSVPTSAPTPRVLSPAEAAHFMEAQTLSATDAEEENRAGEISTADGKESTDAQALPTARSEEENRAHELSTTDNGKGDSNCDELNPDGKESIDAQAFSTAHSKEEAPACELSTTDNGEDGLNGDELDPDGEENTDAQPIRTARSEEENRADEISTADAEEGDGNSDELDPDGEENTDAQALPTDHSEEENRACEISTADNEKDELNGDELDPDGEENTDAQAISTTDIEEGIDAQALSTARSEEDARTCESDAADIGGNMDTQAISTKKERFSTRSPHGPAPPTDDAHNPTAARHCPPPHSTEKHTFPLNLNHDAPPILPLHPPAPVGLGCALRVQSAQPPFGRAHLGRIDIGSAPCPAGSRPLHPQPAEDRRNLPEDRRQPANPAPLGGAHEPKTADFIDNSTADEHPSRSDAGEHHSDEPQRRDFAEKRCPDVPHDRVHKPKTADFIDNSVAHEPQRHAADGEHSADQHNSPADEHPHRPNEPEHPTDEFDAGQRLLDTDAHRRAVRTELAACCDALCHLAHCCVAF